MGINLVAACRMVIFDEPWNPGEEPSAAPALAKGFHQELLLSFASEVHLTTNPVSQRGLVMMLLVMFRLWCVMYGLSIRASGLDDCLWSAAVYSAQAAARIFRYGQTRRTYIYRTLYYRTMEWVLYRSSTDRKSVV